MDGDDMVTNDIGKMGLLALVAVIAGACLVTGTMSEVAAVGIFSGIVGYLTGNGVNAVRKRAPSPALVAKLPDGLVEDEAAKQAAVQLVETAAQQAGRQGWPAEHPGAHTAPQRPNGGPFGPWEGPR